MSVEGRCTSSGEELDFGANVLEKLFGESEITELIELTRKLEA
jgi:hypothetical protein